MQLTIITFALVFFMFLQDLKAQVKKYYNDNSNSNYQDQPQITQESYVRPDWKKVNVDFLTSYYEQDGNNSPVTGGIGTEYLTDFTQKLKVKIPTNKKLDLNIDAAYDYYSSASTDNIDNIRSSDSSADLRSQLNVGLQYHINESQDVGLRLGTSTEYDYTSFNAAFNYSILSANENTSFGIQGQMFYDTWLIIYPRELRSEVSLPTDKRQSYNLALNLSQVINKRNQIAIMAEGTYMSGLLSTPFHRVYFQEVERPSIEILPDNRLKIPIGMRWNSYLSNRLILRSYYRYYWDSWGMHAHTVNIELPIKLNRFFAVYPHIRYHTQTAVEYFKPYKEHSLQDQFVTSDYDLSDLQSLSYGLGILYSKADGIASIKVPFVKDKKLTIASIDLKYSHFDRSTGLTANIISLGVGFEF